MKNNQYYFHLMRMHIFLLLVICHQPIEHHKNHHIIDGFVHWNTDKYVNKKIISFIPQ